MANKSKNAFNVASDNWMVFVLCQMWTDEVPRNPSAKEALPAATGVLKRRPLFTDTHFGFTFLVILIWLLNTTGKI